MVGEGDHIALSASTLAPTSQALGQDSSALLQITKDIYVKLCKAQYSSTR